MAWRYFTSCDKIVVAALEFARYPTGAGMDISIFYQEFCYTKDLESEDIDSMSITYHLISEVFIENGHQINVSSSYFFGCL